MDKETLNRRLLRIKKKLKKLHAWNKGYLEESIDNQLRLRLNRLTNSGDEAQVRFLLLTGLGWEEIVNDAKRIQKVVQGHQVYLAKLNSKSRKHKKDKKSKRNRN